MFNDGVAVAMIIWAMSTAGAVLLPARIGRSIGRRKPGELSVTNMLIYAVVALPLYSVAWWVIGTRFFRLWSGLKRDAQDGWTGVAVTDPGLQAHLDSYGKVLIASLTLWAVALVVSTVVAVRSRNQIQVQHSRVS